MKGRFIVFEGVDGSGKGTIMEKVKNYLIKKGIPKKNIIATREPTDGEYGQKARELQRKDSLPEEEAHKMLDYYVNDRVEHLGTEIVPALNKGKLVLCDRYKYSTIVYQFAQGLPLRELVRMHEKMEIPDLILIFDVPADIAIGRIVKDKNRELIEKFEKKEFLEKVRTKFLDLPNFLHENIVIIDASKPIDEVFEETKNEIDKLLKLS